jgi:hypothetical protein
MEMMDASAVLKTNCQAQQVSQSVSQSVSQFGRSVGRSVGRPVMRRLGWLEWGAPSNFLFLL